MTPRHPDGADGRRTVAGTRRPVLGDDGDDEDEGARLIQKMLFHSSRIYVLFLQWDRSRDDDLQPRFTPCRARRAPGSMRTRGRRLPQIAELTHNRADSDH